MTNDQLAAAIAAIIVTHGASIWAIIKFGFKKAIDWTHMVRDIAEMKADIEKLKLDVNASHQKIRSSSQKTS